MDILFVSLLVLVISLTVWAINTYRSKRVDSKVNQFKKGKTEYLEPPRPHSESYENFLRLTSSIYSKQQKKIVLTMSQLIKDYINLGGIITVSDESLNLSESLKLLLTDPDKWYYLQLNTIDRSELSRKEGLSEQYIQILDEVQQLLNISLISEME